jgi:maltose alpha-D-glucosyltransferase/alpha-amylase
VAPVVGSLEYVPEPKDPSGATEHMVLGLLHGFVPNEGDAWQYTLDALGRYYERVMTQQVKPTPEAVGTPGEPLWSLGGDDLPPLAFETLGAFLPSVQLLGLRTAELHLAMASRSDDPAFAPEPFSKLFQRSLYQSLRNVTGRVFEALGRYVECHPTEHEAEARKVLSFQDAILKRFWAIHEKKITARRIRCHGDLHLGKILRAGKDFVFIDFEGEPYRSLSERRLKRSPLRDVASLIRSFHSAAYTVLYLDPAGGVFRPEDIQALEPRARMWNYWVSMVFLRSYFEGCAQASFHPATREETLAFLRLYYLERLVFELGYELLNRPERLVIPLRGILRALE